MSALQVPNSNRLDMVVNFEDGQVEEEIDKFNNGNNVKLNNLGDDFIDYKHKRVSLQFQMQQKMLLIEARSLW